MANFKTIITMATATIKNPRTRQFTKHASTMSFATTQKKSIESQSEWDIAIANGAVTVDEFIDELKALIAQWPDDEA